ncbi:hypothetical protein ACIQWR_20800 [Streptomyces sp. NPDC098789]|uniref:hypothetical protein n=1 Tax=Streptomyces sp. NPDC098789 TaxID=3366098 RepID=UPI003825A141
MADGQDDWERRNEAAYGAVAWRRAVLNCGALVVWHTGFDNRTPPGPRGPRPGRPDAPGAAEFTSRWMPVVALLALAACRVAREADVLVDDVELLALFGRVDGPRTDSLYRGPLETGEPRGRTEAGWRALVGGSERGRRAREVLGVHVTAHLAEEHDEQARHEEHARRDEQDERTPEGAEPLPLLLGDRARAVRAAGVADLAPQWAGDVAGARARIERLDAALRAGLWTPTPEHRAYALILHRTLVAPPDYPGLPDGSAGPAWVQRVLRMPHVHATVVTLTDLPAFARFGPAGPAEDPLAEAVGAVAHDAVHSLVGTADDLERLWAARPPDLPVALWERAHLPPPVRAQIVAVERVTHELAMILFDIAHPDADR